MGRIVLGLLILTCALGASHSPSSQPSDGPLPEGSKWGGTLLRDQRIATSKDRPCHARILSRDGEKFTASFSTTSGNARVSLKIEGTIDRDGNIKASVTEILAGEAAAVGKEWTGKANDKEWLLEWTAKNGAHRRAELRLDTGKGKKGKAEEN
jgi:hypothetical protein